VDNRGGRKLEFTLAVPARRYADLAKTFQKPVFDDDGLAESPFAGHRLIVSHDPERARVGLCGPRIDPTGDATGASTEPAKPPRSSLNFLMP
jgi:hypothetical protein